MSPRRQSFLPVLDDEIARGRVRVGTHIGHLAAVAGVGLSPRADSRLPRRAREHGGDAASGPLGQERLGPGGLAGCSCPAASVVRVVPPVPVTAGRDAGTVTPSNELCGGCP